MADDYRSPIGRFDGLSADHPSVGDLCKICDKPMLEGDVPTLVNLAPASPEDDLKAMTGRAHNVIAGMVHETCAYPGKRRSAMGDEPEKTTSLEFATMARNLGAIARAMELTVPGFRSPPETEERRTLRTHPDGSIVVAVRLDQHPVMVACDLADGILAANQVPLEEREDRRRELLSVVKHLTGGNPPLREGEEPF